MITVEDFVRREVHVNVGSLVADLYTLVSNADRETLAGLSVDEDDLLNIMSQDDYEEPVEEFIRNMSRDDLVETLELEGVEDDRDQSDILLAQTEDLEMGLGSERAWPGTHENTLRDKLFAHLKEKDELQDFASNNNIEPHTLEAYEHWAVTDWFGEKLRDKGEMVADIGNLVVWGRTTTGQMISMDWVVQEIHKDLTERNA